MDGIMRNYIDLANLVFSGMKRYTRDVNLKPDQFNQYKVGQVLIEKGFTDASAYFEGMVTTHRFTIISNHMSDLSEFEHGTGWGLHVATSGSHFKVLDIYQYKGKTQILLLHLPNDYRWRFYINATFPQECALIDVSRDSFKMKAFKNARSSLTTEDWLKRCQFPIGMSDEAVLFELEMTINDQKQNIRDVGFRELYQEFIYIDCGELIKSILPDILEDDDNGLVAYCYIDDEMGLSFRPVAIAKERSDDLETREFPNDIMLVLRYESVEDCQYCQLDFVTIDLEQYDGIKDEVRGSRTLYAGFKEKTRELEWVDQFRHPSHPDDVLVALVKEELDTEYVWVRLSSDLGVLTGNLLNQPQMDFGISLREEIKIYVHEISDEEIVLVSPQ